MITLDFSGFDIDSLVLIRNFVIDLYNTYFFIERPQLLSQSINIFEIILDDVIDLY